MDDRRPLVWTRQRKHWPDSKYLSVATDSKKTVFDNPIMTGATWRTGQDDESALV